MLWEGPMFVCEQALHSSAQQGSITAPHHASPVQPDTALPVHCRDVLCIYNVNICEPESCMKYPDKGGWGRTE